jgi:hypothetical protein
VTGSRAGRVVCALGLVGAMAGCASLNAGAHAALPALITPEPPPRTVTPLPSEPADTGPRPVILPASPAPGRVSRPPQPKATSDRPDAPAVPPAAAESAARPSTEEASRGASLQTTAHTEATERRVRDLMTRASRDLGLVDARRLSPGEKAQYDSARRFVAQAEEALKARNLVFAEQLADKAAELAAGLRERFSPATPA